MTLGWVAVTLACIGLALAAVSFVGVAALYAHIARTERDVDSLRQAADLINQNEQDTARRVREAFPELFAPKKRRTDDQ